MDAAEQFFYQHAGYSHNPSMETAEEGRRRGARELASAESAARAAGWWTMVDRDPEGPMDDDVDSVGTVRRGEAVCLVVTLYAAPDEYAGDGLEADPRVLGSLGNVIVPSDSDPYLRVVAAELAAGALDG